MREQAGFQRASYVILPVGNTSGGEINMGSKGRRTSHRKEVMKRREKSGISIDSYTIKPEAKQSPRDVGLR